MELKEQILDLSRQNKIGPLSPWFSEALDRAIEDDFFLDEFDLETVRDKIIEQLIQYREQTGAATVVLGMSGGVDSALTAALFNKAGYRVIGVTMPIHQAPDETDRGIEACSAIGIEHLHADLTTIYDQTLAAEGAFDEELLTGDSKAVRIRRGNIRARLRMITLYNLASLNQGFVASTDNFSELTAGFWTLHGDVGDVSPIQSLLKSWEVPYLAKLCGVPESTYRATPTDGLGVDSGDEAQLGATYLEWDLMTLAIFERIRDYSSNDVSELRTRLELDEAAGKVFDAVTQRMGATWFKRMNPVNLQHAFEDRYMVADELDRMLFRPRVVRGFEFMTPGIAGVNERNR